MTIKGKWGKTQLEKDLRNILRELVGQVQEVKKRKDQPEFNKGLDIICDYDEAIQKILVRTAVRDMYQALLIARPYLISVHIPRMDLERIEKAIFKAEGRS